MVGKRNVIFFAKRGKRTDIETALERRKRNAGSESEENSVRVETVGKRSHPFLHKGAG